MLFIHPMWDNESERVGMQKCTPLGYRLHHTGEGVGFFGCGWQTVQVKI